MSHLKPQKRANLNRAAIIIAAVSGLLALGLTLVIRHQPLFPGDLAFTHFWQSLADPALTAVMKVITYIFGDWRAVIVAAVVTGVFAWRFGRIEGAAVALSALLTLFNSIFKSLIRRPRPSADLVQVMSQESNFSFPSSHAFFSIIFLGIIIYILDRRLKKGPSKLFLSASLGILILVIGFTRVYLGVHWYSDMLAGYLYGGFFLSFLILGYDYWITRHPL